MSVRSVEPALDSADPVMVEVFKCWHIFRSLGSEYGFVICQASNLPLMVQAPLRIMTTSPFVCFFGNPMTKSLNYATITVERLQKSKQREALSLDELLSVETVAHFFRHSAILETDADERRALFKKAMVLYKTALYECKLKPVRRLLGSARLSERFELQPVPGVAKVDTEVRRRISHCFAGMAVCTLMADGFITDFMPLAAASIVWDAKPLEMANVLRTHLLLTSAPVIAMLNPKRIYSVLDRDCSMPIANAYRRFNAAYVKPLLGDLASAERALLYTPDEWDAVSGFLMRE